MKAECESLCDAMRIHLPEPFADVVCTWIQADPREPQIPYCYRRRYCAALSKGTLQNSARECHMSPRHQQQ